MRLVDVVQVHWDKISEECCECHKRFRQWDLLGEVSKGDVVDWMCTTCCRDIMGIDLSKKWKEKQNEKGKTMKTMHMKVDK